MILEKAQSLTTPLILSKLGYNQNMPKSVVYSPTSHSGLGLRHLFTEQGVQKILQMIKHIRARPSLGTLIESTIQAYQIQAGLIDSVLIDTHPLPWTPNRWINSLRHTLHTIKGQIVLNNLWTIPPSRVNDRYLMDDFLDTGHDTNTLKMINNCRMFLQVTTLAEITNCSGTHLLPEVLLQGRSHPTLTSTSNSNYNWPTQPDPGYSAWKTWTKSLQAYYTKPGLPTTL